MKKIYLMACTALILSACGNKQQKSKINSSEQITQVTDMHNAENALDYEGTYKGVFPAADCPGIETTLILKKDKSFAMDSQYIDRNQSFNESGKYTINGNLLTLISNSGAEEYYKVEENQLRKLDMDKQEITGELAEHYILKKES